MYTQTHKTQGEVKDLILQALEIMTKYETQSPYYMRRMFLKDFDVILQIQDCAELIQEIKENKIEKVNEN